MSVRTRLLTGLALSLTIIAGFAPRAWATTLEQAHAGRNERKNSLPRSYGRAVTGSHVGTHGSHGTDVYTYFQLQVIETWKSAGQKTLPRRSPFPAARRRRGIRQSVTGAPELKPGQEYVLFLWTSRSGLTQVIGLSQGLFKVSEEGSGGGTGVAVVQRPAASELMLDRSGLRVEDQAVSMQLPDLRTHVRQALASAKLGAVKLGVAK